MEECIVQIERHKSIHGICENWWIYPCIFFNFSFQSQCGICGKFFISNFHRSGPCGKISNLNFHRSGIVVKNIDLCNFLELGNVYRVYNLKNEEVHIFQEREIIEFSYVTTVVGKCGPQAPPPWGGGANF